MTFQELVSYILQALAAASVLGAAVVWVRGIVLNRGALPLVADGSESKSRMQLLAWAVLAAVGSRLLLCLFAWGLLALGGQAPSMQGIWSKWDAPHYLDIARLGYTADASLGDQWLFIVFYPLYPLLTAALALLTGNEFSAAMLLSWACLVLVCFYLYRLAEMDGGHAGGARAVKYLLIFPSAVFLGAPYTESLFLLLSVLCLLAMRRGRWAWAGVAGFFAALTRNVGVLLALPFLVELLDQLGVFAEPRRLRTREFWFSFLKKAPWAILIVLGMAAYLLLNLQVYGDAFMFLKVQDGHWGQHAQLFVQTISTTYFNLFSQDTATVAFLWAPQLLGMLATLAALPWLVKRLRPAYSAYLLLYLVVALSPSWLLSYNRYMMGCVPLLLGLAAAGQKKWLDRALTVAFFVLMVYLAVGYVTGRMVV